MLLTNQKTINYENLLAKQGKLPPYFASANVKMFFELFLVKFQL